MKLLFFIGSLGSGGAERVLAVLTNELAKRGYDITIGVLTNSPSFYDLDPLIKVKYFPFQKKSNLLGKLGNRVKIQHFIRNLCKSENPDVIISFIYKINTQVLLSTLFLNIPIIISEHNTLDVKMGVWERIQRFHISKLANRITILTQHDYKFLGRRLKNKLVMPNPLPFDPIPNYNDNRDKVILAIGSIVRYRHKGFDNLVNIWIKIADKYPDWKLQIAGGYDDESLDILKSSEKASNIQNKIEYLGQIKDVKSLMNRSSIFILSSRWEGFPMVLMESMSQGCTCISYDLISGPNEMIHPNFDGILIDNQNQDKMIEGLEDLIKDSEKRKKLSINAIRSISQFSVKNIVDKWENLFEELIK